MSEIHNFEEIKESLRLLNELIKSEKATNADGLKHLRSYMNLNLLGEQVPHKVSASDENISISFKCPFCDIGGEYKGSREQTNYYVTCHFCGASLELIPE